MTELVTILFPIFFFIAIPVLMVLYFGYSFIS